MTCVALGMIEVEGMRLFRRSIDGNKVSNYPQTKTVADITLLAADRVVELMAALPAIVA